MNKLLIANRGEIAVRVIRTCREMGLGTVAIYSQCDRNALHVRLADEAYAIGPDQASESYLRIDRIIDVARRSGADGVHPGYGFLAENPLFAEACSHAGITFVGPDAKAMRQMGSKTAAREVAASAGVPVVPGGDDPDAVGYPLLVKAVAGGGGKGMRVVRTSDQLASAVQMARSEAQSAFGDDRCISSGCSRNRDTSRCSSSATFTAPSCRSSSASARFSAAIRSSSRKRPLRR